MSRSLALSLNGNSSIINTISFPFIELNGRYECALIDFSMYNSIPNIDEKIPSSTSVTRLLQFQLDHMNLMISPISFTIIEKTITLKIHLKFKVIILHFNLK